jgi:cytochrome P450
MSKPSFDAPDVSSFSFWSQPAAQRSFTFEQLRRTAPVSFQKPPDFGAVGDSPGFWAVTRHADVITVSRNPDLFCSSQGIGMGDTSADMLELNASFPVMDPPQLTALRRVVSGAFTPKRVAQLEHRIAVEAEHIVDEFVENGGGDVVEGFSRKLPLWTICEILGVPESMRARLSVSAEALIAADDQATTEKEEGRGPTALKAGMDIHRMARALIADRRSNPGDDVLSDLVHSTLDGEPLSAQILRNIFALFLTAGNDTTRNSTSVGCKLFADNPAQWSLLVRDRTMIAPAVEELVRCVTPVIHFGRTARADTVLGGAEIAEGDSVVMFYESANRDESVFQDPENFDIARNPNPHLGFGGGGVHFCLGANLARAELRALFTRLAERATSIEVGEPDYLVSNFFNGIKAMPVRVVAG